MVLNARTVCVVVCLVVAGCSPSGGKSSGGAGGGRSAVAAADGGVHRLGKAELRKVERVITVTGSLLALDETPVAVRVAGRLESIAVDLGSVVRAGDLLAQVEAADYALQLRQSEAALGQARARVGLPLEGEDDRMDVVSSPAVMEARAVLDEARANRDRIRELSAQGILPASELETATSAFTVATSRHADALEEARIRVAALNQRRAEVEIARKRLADTRIVAPFDGAVQERRANVGEYLALGSPVLVLVRMDPLRLRVEVSERDSVRVRAGQVVRLRVEGDPAAYLGEVRRLSPAIRAGSRTLVVEADVPSQGRLRPGSFARAEIVTMEEVPSVTVPAEAVLAFAGVEKVFEVREGKAVETPVTTGERGLGWVEVVSGLKGGEVVVLLPGGLQTGQLVRAEGGGAGTALVAPGS